MFAATGDGDVSAAYVQFTSLLDGLGLITFEAYARTREKLVSAQSEQLLESVNAGGEAVGRGDRWLDVGFRDGAGAEWFPSAGRRVHHRHRGGPGDHGDHHQVVQVTVLFEGEDVAWFRGELAGTRGAAAALARRCGFDEHRAAEVALAVAEATSNLDKPARDCATVRATDRLRRRPPRRRSGPSVTAGRTIRRRSLSVSTGS